MLATASLAKRWHCENSAAWLWPLCSSFFCGAGFLLAAAADTGTAAGATAGATGPGEVDGCAAAGGDGARASEVLASMGAGAAACGGDVPCCWLCFGAAGSGGAGSGGAGETRCCKCMLPRSDAPSAEGAAAVPAASAEAFESAGIL
eukprot:132467-Pelagomonas_calceolata.AAC.7